MKGKDKVTAEFSCQAVTSDGLLCKHVVRFLKLEEDGLVISKDWMSINWLYHRNKHTHWYVPYD
jgi:hypothetical protein